MSKKSSLTISQREKFAEKLMEWGNLVFIGLVIGQLVPGTERFRLSIALTGAGIMLLSYLIAYVIMRKRSK